MQVSVTVRNRGAIDWFTGIPKRFRGRFERDMKRALVDAGRKTKTKTQRAVYRQGGFKPGTYQSAVASQTHGHLKPGQLAYAIRSNRKGQRLPAYKGLRSTKRGIKTAAWNNPRIFEDAYEENGRFFTPVGNGVPRKLTFGHKPNQPRDGRGRFAVSKIQYATGKHELFGPAVRSELGRDDALREFQTFAPAELGRQVQKRITKLLRY